jgi:hypothetical protein
MIITSCVLDDFLENPNSVRESALENNFFLTGNFPGSRTNFCDENYYNYLKNKLENIFNFKIKENFQKKLCFQLCLEKDDTWIHTDEYEYTGIIFLTPNAPVESGTGIYRHKEKNTFLRSDNEIFDNDLKNWEMVNMIGNVYNRLILIRGDSYHRSILPGFGNNKTDGRLTQVFFFNTSKE